MLLGACYLVMSRCVGLVEVAVSIADSSIVSNGSWRFIVKKFLFAVSTFALLLSSALGSNPSVTLNPDGLFQLAQSEVASRWVDDDDKETSDPDGFGLKLAWTDPDDDDSSMHDPDGRNLVLDRAARSMGLAWLEDDSEDDDETIPDPHGMPRLAWLEDDSDDEEIPDPNGMQRLA